MLLDISQVFTVHAKIYYRFLLIRLHGSTSIELFWWRLVIWHYRRRYYGALKPSNNNEACRCKLKADEFVIINHHQSILFK
jgi:hypothetical protein